MKKRFLLFFTFLLSATVWFAAGIEPGIYRIASQYNSNRVLFIENSSLDNSAKAVAWTETGTNSQRWRITPDESGNYYCLTNVYSGQNLRMAGSAAKGVGVNQTVPSSAVAQKWTIEPAGASGYYISSASLLNGQKLYLELVNGEKLDSDGAPLQLWTKDEENLPRRIWTLERVEEIPNQFTVALRTEMMQAWKDRYYKEATVGYDIGGGFWGCAENLEILLDAYENTGYAEYKTMFEEAYRNFIYRNSSNWMGNDFNDDIAWICIAGVRAYLMMGNSVSGINFLSNAKTNFDSMYKRALIKTNSYYLLRWKEGNGDGTGSCINGPAEVAACYLAMATGDNTYYEKAKMLYGNQRIHLYNPATGQVYDSTSDGGSTNYWASTYNQGTYLGAAVMLYNRYGDEMYKQDAHKIIQYTRDHLCNSHGVINVCGGGADLPGFKGILMRYVRRYITDLRQPQWIDWMHLNALHAYNNRNSAGVTWTAWWEKSTEDFKRGSDNYDSFGCGPAVSVAVNSPMDKNSIVKNAFANIEAGSFNYLKGVVAENNTTGETAEITGMKNGDYLVYSNVDFRKIMPAKIELTLANDNTPRTIEIRADSLTGMKIAEIVVPASDGTFTTLEGVVSPIDGMHNTWLIFKGEANGLRLKSFRFIAGDVLYPDITDNDGILSFSHPATSGNNLIDNRLSTPFQMTCNSDAAWIQYRSKTPVRLQGYALASSGESNVSDPKTWKLQASDNGSDWTDIDSRQEQTFTERYQLKRYDLPEPSVYSYFRLQITQRSGNSETLALAEWQLFGSALFADDITADGGTLSGQFSGLQDGEVVETLEKLTDKTPTSKYTVKDQNNLWIQYKATGKYRLKAYSLTSADVFADHAPKNWTIYGSNDGSDWTEIDSQFDQAFTHGQVSQTYICNESAEGFSYFKLHVTANGGNADTQFAEWQLFGERAYSEYFTNLLTTATSANSSEDLQNLTDKDATTIVSIPKTTASISIEYRLPAASLLLACSITPAGNPDNDPKAWTLQGSTDGETWTTVQTRSNESFELRYVKKEYTISTTKEYQYFRWNFTALNNADANELQLAELELHGTAIDKYDVTSNAGGELSAQFAGNANEESGALIDQSKTTKYCISGKNSFWAHYRSPRAVRLMAYSLTAANDNPDRDPKSWKLYVSEDGTQWTEIDSRTGEIFPYRYATLYYTCSTDKKYSHFKLEITENCGASTVQLAEWQLFGEYNDFKTDLTDNSGGILTASHPASDGTDIMNLIDNKENTKYYLSIATLSSGVWFQYQSPQSVAVASYSLTSAPDNPNNDPKAWKLQASNDGLEWKDIDSRSDQFFDSRCERKFFPAVSDGAYTYYRLLIIERNKNLDRGLHLSEWELFDTDHTQIIQPVQKTTVSIYPNPSVDFIKINTPDRAKISIYNTIGQLMYSREKESGEIIISTNNYKQGVYIVKIQSYHHFLCAGMFLKK